MRGNMLYVKEKCNENFQYGVDPCYITFFREAIAHDLKYVCGAVPDEVTEQHLVERLCNNVILSYLKTIDHPTLQSSHCNFEHTCISTRMTKMKKKKSHVYMPWCFDIPLNDHGLRLGVWGAEYPQNAGEKCTRIQ